MHNARNTGLALRGTVAAIALSVTGPYGSYDSSFDFVS